MNTTSSSLKGDNQILGPLNVNQANWTHTEKLLTPENVRLIRIAKKTKIKVLTSFSMEKHIAYV